MTWLDNLHPYKQSGQYDDTTPHIFFGQFYEGKIIHHQGMYVERGIDTEQEGNAKLHDILNLDDVARLKIKRGGKKKISVELRDKLIKGIDKGGYSQRRISVYLGFSDAFLSICLNRCELYPKHLEYLLKIIGEQDV